jgi:hypothetical protein
MGAFDAPGERFPVHLPANFACGCIFLELRKGEFESWQALEEMVRGFELRDFWGGTILRCEGKQLPETGRVHLATSEQRMERMSATSGPPLTLFALSIDQQIGENLYGGFDLQWTEHGFAEHAFDLIAMISGTYSTRHPSSMHAFGNSFLEGQVGPSDQK